MIRKLNGQKYVMKLVDWLGCQYLLICDSTYLELMNLIKFGKHNEIRGHQLENELISLNPSDFSCIQDYLSKYKTPRLLCEESLTTTSYQDPSLESFCDSLIREQDNLIILE